ncbi:hypothetical protein Hanom_Chr11g00972921 [Helianthus anomalus]
MLTVTEHRFDKNIESNYYILTMVKIKCKSQPTAHKEIHNNFKRSIFLIASAFMYTCTIHSKII